MAQVNLNLPTPGADRETWGTKNNTALDTLAAQGNASDTSISALNVTVANNASSLNTHLTQSTAAHGGIVASSSLAAAGGVATLDGVGVNAQPPQAHTHATTDTFVTIPLCASDGTVPVGADVFPGGVRWPSTATITELHAYASETPVATSTASGYLYLGNASSTTPAAQGTPAQGGVVSGTAAAISYANVAANRIAYVFGHHSLKAVTVTPPSGWTQVYNFTEPTGSDYGRSFCYSKVLTGSESGSITFTLSSATDCTLIMVCVASQASSSPTVAGTSSYSFTNALQIIGPPPTSTTDLLLAAIGQGGNTANTATFPGGWTKISEYSRGSSCVAVGTKTSGSTTASTITVATSSTLNEIGTMLAVKSAVSSLLSWTISAGSSSADFTGLAGAVTAGQQVHFATTANGGLAGLNIQVRYS